MDTTTNPPDSPDAVKDPKPSSYEWVQRIRKDLLASSGLLSAREVRFLVDTYYAVQNFRIAAGGQERAADKLAEPHVFVTWIMDQFWILESEIKKALDRYAQEQRPGRWAMSQHGIGPVITAGLLAHIDITRAPTVGHIWSFAGLNPEAKWKKGEKRPWNARLKVLCWKIGESFKKTYNSPKSIYGKVYRDRKAFEVEKNDSGARAEQAAQTLAEKNIRDKETRAKYEAGKLPDGRLDARACRYATKLFLAHMHHVMYESHYGKEPPKPYVVEHLGHVHAIKPPMWPCE